MYKRTVATKWFIPKSFNILVAGLLVIGTIVVTLPTHVFAFAGGDGTLANPWLISDCTELQQMDDSIDLVDDHFKLNANFSCSGVDFNPLGWPGDFGPESFTGVFDGDGHTIDALTINKSGVNVGLFSATGTDAVIKNLNITNANITNEAAATAAVIGYAGNTTVANVTVTNSTVSNVVGGSESRTAGIIGSGDTVAISDAHVVNSTISGAGRVGGIAGSVNNLVIDNSDVTAGSITSTKSKVGGIAGNVQNGSQTTYTNLHSSTPITLTSEDSAGGLFGYIAGASLTDVYATGNVTADGGTVGGLVGRLDDAALIVRAYATGDVSVAAADESVGGFVGAFWGESTIRQSYAAGDVTSANSYGVGGFAGRVAGGSSNPQIIDSFALGSVHGYDGVGGFAGITTGSGGNSFTRVYSTGAVSFTHSGGVDVGGLVGSSVLGAVDSFWDTTTSGMATSQAGTGKATADMKNVATYTDLATAGLNQAWDFAGNPNDDSANDNIWSFGGSLNGGYPCLSWQGGCDQPQVSEDNDGISATIENAAPNGGDGNNDGTPDAEQANVASFVNAESSKYVTIAVPVQCTLSAVLASDVSDNAEQDSGYVYTDGMLNFTAQCGTNGFSMDVSLYYYGVSPQGLVLRKYNPMTTNYMAVDGATLVQSSMGGSSVLVASYTVVDGGVLDSDGVANGTIVDPVGLASLPGGELAATGDNLWLAIATMTSTMLLGSYLLLRVKRS